MTGSFVVKGIKAASYKSFKIVGEEVWPPKFTKMELIFENGARLAFCDPRRFGRVKLRDGDPTICEPILGLARDPIVDGIDLLEFQAGLMKSLMPIKSLLLDQSKLVCGIGNWVADEVLYQAGIHPLTPAKSINKLGAELLSKSIIDVLQVAIARKANSEVFPDTWIFHVRWDKGDKDGPKAMPNGDKVIYITVGGRTTAVVEKIQVKNGTYNSIDSITSVSDLDGNTAEISTGASKKIDKKTVVKRKREDSDTSSIIKPKSSPVKTIKIKNEATTKAVKTIKIKKEATRKAVEIIEIKNEASTKATKIIKIKKEASTKAVKTIEIKKEATNKTVKPVHIKKEVASKENEETLLSFPIVRTSRTRSGITVDKRQKLN